MARKERGLNVEGVQEIFPYNSKQVSAWVEGLASRETGMTLLKKKVTREIDRPFDHQVRNIIVEIEPPNLISFREKGRRRRYTSTTNLLMQLIIQAEKERELRERKGKKRR